MILLPKGKPTIEKLNSFFLDIRKMIEHYQGELGAGCVHFLSATDEGLIFFDKDELLNGVLNNANGETKGTSIIDLIVKTSALQNFNIDIYKIDSGMIYFWANIPYAKKIHDNLSTEHTDLEKLIEKMRTENLTGYIDVSISQSKDGGLIFFSNGELVGESYSWTNAEPNGTKKDMALLVQKTNSEGGIFNVSHIPMEPPKDEIQVAELIDSGPEPSKQFEILEELLIVFESIVISQKKIRSNCKTLLKKKFVEKINKYDFLDPFTEEFKYADEKITYVGNASKKEVVVGVIECVTELAKEHSFLPILVKQLDLWSEKYSKEIKEYNIRF